MTIDTSHYQHFSFDLWLTLIKSNPVYKKKRNELFKDFFSIEADIEIIQKIVKYYDVLCNKINETTGSHIDREEIYYMILNRLEVDMENVTHSKLRKFSALNEDLFMLYKPDLIYSDIHIAFKKIQSEGKTMSILSNTAFIHGNMLRKILSHYGLSSFLSFQLYSDEVGYSKPNRQIFELLFTHTNKIKNICRKEIVHIGDNETADFAGATAAGLKSILIKYPYSEPFL